LRLGEYILIRAVLAIPTLFILLTVVFVVMRIIPGDPIVRLVGEKMTAEQIAALRHAWGLDKPIYFQFTDYLVNLAQGNLGYSIVTHETVIWEIQQALPATLELSLAALFVGSVWAVFLAVLAVRYRGITDAAVQLFTFWAYSTPVFWLALLLQIGLGVDAGVLPVYGRESAMITIPRITGLHLIDTLITLNFVGFVDSLIHLILPTFCLCLWILPIICRICRSSMIQNLSEQYVVTATAKGLQRSVIMTKYALRNALLPTVTTIGAALLDLLGGSVITESRFAWPGMGRLFLQSALNRDFPVIQGVVIIYVALVIALSTGLDVIYSVVDPRVRLVKEK
jgi:peptide/nickel transport system permease protein